MTDFAGIFGTSRRRALVRHILYAVLLLVIGACITAAAWGDILVRAWKDEESGHIFLVLPVAAWLVFVRRARLRHCRLHSSYAGCLIVAVGWMASSWGFYRSVHSFFHGGAVLVAIGCVVTALGRDVLVRFLPAFVVLVFLVPVPGRVRSAVSQPLMTITAQATQEVSELAGVRVDRTGNKLTIRGRDVAVEEACNGLRMVFALVLVSFAFAFGEPLKNYVRAIILMASPLSAIVCNVIRLVPTVWIYGYADKSFADGFHETAGWAMLVVAFFMLMGIIRVLRWAYVPVAPYTLAAQ